MPNEMKDLIVLNEAEAAAYDKMPAVKINAEGAMVPQDLKELFYFSRIMAYSGMVPKDCANNPGVIMAKVQYGATLGLDAMTSIQSIANVGNIPAPFGDVVLGIVRKTNTLEEFFELEIYPTEEDEGTGNETAICIAKRTDIGTHVDLGALRAEDAPWPKVIEALKLNMYFVNTFSVDDMTVAGLGSKDNWKNHPKRMRKMRARSFTLRDGWPDYLKGMHTKEELDGETIDLQPSKNGKFERAEKGPEDLKAKLEEAPIVLDKPQPKPEPEKDPDPDDDPDGTKASPKEELAEIDDDGNITTASTKTEPPPPGSSPSEYKSLEDLVDSVYYGLLQGTDMNIKVLNYPEDCEINAPGWSTIATYIEDDLLTGKQFLVPVSGFPNARLVRFLSGSKRMAVKLQGGADVEKPEINDTADFTKDEFIKKAEDWAEENCTAVSVFMKTFYRYLDYVARIREKSETREDIIVLAAGPDTIAENWFKKALAWDKMTAEIEDNDTKIYGGKYGGGMSEADADMGKTQGNGPDLIDLSGEGAQESEAHDEIRSRNAYMDYDPLTADYINRYSKFKVTKICDLLAEHKIDYAPSWSGGKLHATLKEGVPPIFSQPGDDGAYHPTVEDYRERIRDFPQALVEAVQAENKMVVGIKSLPATVGGCKHLLDLLIAETS